MKSHGFGGLPSLPDFRLDPDDEPHREDCPAFGSRYSPCLCPQLDREDRLSASEARWDYERENT